MSDRILAFSAITIGAVVAMAMGAHAAPLPGGASTLTETYQDWTVACQTQQDKTNCIMNQMQNSSQTGQRVLSVELHNTPEGKTEGVLLMPFGLDLAKGATLKIDGTQAPGLAYSTCLPQGCLAPLSFDAKEVAKLKAAGNLNITATALSPSQPVAFKVSLKGFGTALDRIAALTK
ncbi:MULTISPECIES: invasion associated locus B family protein [Brucella]|uniref:Invasion associated locus B family protein n=1 Tax=Brucella inopinata TaxID=1218315 RepID=A0AAW7B9E9_9HYPH|nr:MULTISPECIES: invasion associated locus B family protein [Brucella]EFM56112.1 invasion associated locus B family protein [Brucella inopinata BO1]EFM60069.1 invasion associated locus B family protein [Brucella sp. BO2]MDL2333487.1 invasion associated locus B family protein [Brucella inopinata]QGA57761.1 invasion associated locus B family protein [Brucella sp. 2280]QPN28554.1 invasion associated locus B family protein [Brucella sp. BO2]